MVRYLVPREELPYDPSDKDSIVRYAERLEGHSLREMTQPNTEIEAPKSGNKGSLGQAVEYYYFQYEPNSNQEPDFPEVGMELKTTPIKRNKNKTISAKERLVITMINYCDVVEEEWETSTCREKMDNVLLISYLHEPEKNIFDYEIEFVGIQDFPENDLNVIRDDWNTIVDKIRDGRAHELSGGDTHYLEACTKGSSSAQLQQQPYSDIKAKTRAFALKSSYMTAFYRNNLGLQAIKRIQGEEGLGFEELVLKRFGQYTGMTREQLKDALGLPQNDDVSKSDYALLTKRILGIDASSQIEEFIKADIVVRTVRIQSKDTIKEHVSFPAFEFDELLEEPCWEDSEFCTACEREFLFVVFKEDGNDYRLSGATFWSMPVKDIEKARSVWSETRRIIREGVSIERMRTKGGQPRYTSTGKPMFSNNLPDPGYNGIAHVRPHASQSAYRLEGGTEYGDIGKDASILPDGRAMTKQSFWLNNTYIRAQLKLKGI